MGFSCLEAIHGQIKKFLGLGKTMIREKKRSAAFFAYHSFNKLSSIFLGKKDGRIRYFGKHSAFTRVFCRKRSFFRFCLWYFSWLFLFAPRFALAEFESNDKTNLQNIRSDVNNINLETQSIHDLLREALSTSGGNGYVGWHLGLMGDDVNDINNKLSYLFGVLGYGYASSQTGTLNDSLIAIKQQIADIYNYQKLPSDGAGHQNWVNLQKLQTISGGLGYTGGYQSTLKYDNTIIIDRLEAILAFLNNTFTGSSSSPQDWVKEDTYTQFAERLWKGLGFADEGGSSLGSPSSLVEMFSTTRYSFPIGPRIFYFKDTEAEGATKTPFPGSTALWINDYPYYEEDQGATRYTYTFPELISYPVVAQLAQNSANEIRIFKKQAWNDWQAHTNLVATLERLLTVTPPEDRVDSIASLGKIEKTESGKEELIIDYGTGTGDSPETIDLNPAVTNTTEELALSVDSTTNTVSRVLSYQTISNRYTDFSRVDNTGYRDYMSFEDIPTSELNLGGGMVVNVGDNFKSVFESLLPMSTMVKLRQVFRYLWLFFYVYANWLLFKITGKAA